MAKSEPLSVAVTVVAAYSRVNNLTDDELALIWPMLGARNCQSVPQRTRQHACQRMYRHACPIHMPTHVSTHMSAHMSPHLSACMAVHMSTHMSTYMSAHMSAHMPTRFNAHIIIHAITHAVTHFNTHFNDRALLHARDYTNKIRSSHNCIGHNYTGRAFMLGTTAHANPHVSTHVSTRVSAHVYTHHDANRCSMPRIRLRSSPTTSTCSSVQPRHGRCWRRPRLWTRLRQLLPSVKRRRQQRQRTLAEAAAAAAMPRRRSS